MLYYQKQYNRVTDKKRKNSILPNKSLPSQDLSLANQEKPHLQSQWAKISNQHQTGDNTQFNEQKQALRELQQQLRYENPIYQQQYQQKHMKKQSNMSSSVDYFQKQQMKNNQQQYSEFSEFMQSKISNLNEQKRIRSLKNSFDKQYQGLTPHQIYDLKTKEYMDMRSLIKLLEKQEEQTIQARNLQSRYQMKRGAQGSETVYLQIQKQEDLEEEKKLQFYQTNGFQDQNENFKYTDQHWGFKTCFFHETSGQSWVPPGNLTLMDDDAIKRQKISNKVNKLDKHELARHLHGNIRVHTSHSRKQLKTQQSKTRQVTQKEKKDGSFSPTKKGLITELRQKAQSGTNSKLKSVQSDTQIDFFQQNDEENEEKSRSPEKQNEMMSDSFKNYYFMGQGKNIQNLHYPNKNQVSELKLLEGGLYKYLAKPNTPITNLRKKVNLPQFQSAKMGGPEQSNKEIEFFRKLKENLAHFQQNPHLETQNIEENDKIANTVQGYQSLLKNLNILHTEEEQKLYNQANQNQLKSNQNCISPSKTSTSKFFNPKKIIKTQKTEKLSSSSSYAKQYKSSHDLLQDTKNQQQTQKIKPKQAYFSPIMSPTIKSANHKMNIQIQNSQKIANAQKTPQMMNTGSSFYKNPGNQFQQTFTSNMTNQMASQQQSQSGRNSLVMNSLGNQNLNQNGPGISLQQLQQKLQKQSITSISLNSKCNSSRKNNFIVKYIKQGEQKKKEIPEKLEIFEEKEADFVPLNERFLNDLKSSQKMKEFFKCYKETLFLKFRAYFHENIAVTPLLDNFMEIQHEQFFMYVQNMYEYSFLQMEGISTDFKYFNMPQVLLQKFISLFNEFVDQREYENIKSSNYLRDEEFSDFELNSYKMEFVKQISIFKPVNLLEKIGGFKQVKRILDEFIKMISDKNEKELQVDFQYFVDNFDQIAKYISDYLKDNSLIPPEYIVQIFQAINLSNLDFFIIKITIWRIMQKYSFPDSVIFEFFAKYEKIRYVVTQIGASLELRESAEFRKHTIICLRNSQLINYMKDISQKGIQKAANTVIDFIYGYLDVEQFLEIMPTCMKKKMDKSFVKNFENLFKEMLQINCGLFKLLIQDFETKMQVIKYKLNHISNNLSDINVNDMLKNLAQWVETQKYNLPDELLMHDIDKLDLLEFFFQYYLSEEQNFSFYDLSVARAYYSVPEILIEFWFQGLEQYIEDFQIRNHFKQLLLNS